MKKVFHFVTTNITSGLEQVVMNICSLVDGYDFVYVSPDGPVSDYLEAKNIKHLVVNKMNPFSVRKVIKKYDPDIVQGHDVKASLYLALNHSYCDKKNIKIISELHSDDFKMHKFSLRSLLYLSFSSYFYRVICVSENVIENYIFKKSIVKKNIVIENIVNPNIFDKSRSNIEIKPFNFLFLGRLEKPKNPELFIKIIKNISKSVPNVTANIIGDGSLEPQITQLINDNDLSKNINMMGHIDNPYPYIKHSDAMIVTSRYEGFGLVALESLLLGKPVISTNVSGLDKIVTDDCGIISNNIDELSQFGIKLISNASLYDNKVFNALKRAFEINDVNSFIRKYKDLYA